MDNQIHDSSVQLKTAHQSLYPAFAPLYTVCFPAGTIISIHGIDHFLLAIIFFGSASQSPVPPSPPFSAEQMTLLGRVMTLQTESF